MGRSWIQDRSHGKIPCFCTNKSMPTNVLLLPLLAGYWFLHTFQYTKFRSQRLDGYRLLVESAAAGVVFAAVAWVGVKILALNPCVIGTWRSVAPNVPFLGTAVLAALLGSITPYVLNWSLNKTRLQTAEQAQYKAISRHGNHLLRLLHSATWLEKAVMVTLDTNKVYIGMVDSAPNMEPTDTFVGMIPFFSGYRHSETRTLSLTVDYLSVYEREGLEPEDFRVVFPISSIRSASFFDQSIYPAFSVETQGGEDAQPAVS